MRKEVKGFGKSNKNRPIGQKQIDAMRQWLPLGAGIGILLILSLEIKAAEKKEFYLDPAQKQQEVLQKIAQFRNGLSPSQRALLARTDKSQKNNLSPSERRRYDDYQRLRAEQKYWEQVIRLQKDLLTLVSSKPDSGKPDEPTQQEAAVMAQTVLSAAPELAKQYRLIRPALFQNLLINTGIRERGFCYHWAGDLLKALQQLNLKIFQLHWGVAHDRKLTEHNSVVITAPAAPFETGLVLDGWRHAGKLYWTLVKKDHYPWKELPLDQVPLGEL